VPVPTREPATCAPTPVPASAHQRQHGRPVRQHGRPVTPCAPPRGAGPVPVPARDAPAPTASPSPTVRPDGESGRAGREEAEVAAQH
jgi:hypothetical protein